jgi:tetratricopeptide (TPR) repeat protein
MYTAHNYQFLAFSAAMEGRRAETIVAGRNSRAAIPDEMLEAMPGADWYVGQLYAGMVRFGMWDEVLAEPAPSAKLNGVTGGWRYARTIALAAKGRVDEARVEVAELEKLAVAVPEDHGAGNNRLKDVLTIAVLAGKARIAGAAGKEDQAIVLLQEAVVKEDRLAYAEPADWFIPTRHLLGVALLNTGKPQEAETVYRADLVRNPENGWALFGLAVALQAQGRDGDAAAVRQRFDKAWAHADIVLAASAF